MAYVLGGLVVLIALAFVGWPLLRPSRRAIEIVEEAPPTPAEQRAAIYRELVELDLDLRLGKVEEADHRALTDALLARAAALLSAEDATLMSVDEQIEREIAEQRRTARTTAASKPERHG